MKIDFIKNVIEVGEEVWLPCDNYTCKWAGISCKF